jgi:hypothetical protein
MTCIVSRGWIGATGGAGGAKRILASGHGIVLVRTSLEKCNVKRIRSNRNRNLHHPKPCTRPLGLGMVLPSKSEDRTPITRAFGHTARMGDPQRHVI